jgi:hypothetical protein
MKDPEVHYGYLIGEKSAVIYWLWDDCTKDEALERITINLTGKYRELYYSIVYGDLDST